MTLTALQALVYLQITVFTGSLTILHGFFTTEKTDWNVKHSLGKTFGVEGKAENQTYI